jgi:hypothetical protein
MPQTYKTLGQVRITPNTLSNIYVTDASTTAIVSSIWICNADVFLANGQIDLVVRPINQAFNVRHEVFEDVKVIASDTNIYNLGITMPPSTILAANLKYLAGETGTPTDFAINAFGVEIT